MRKRVDLPFSWIFVLFGIFIVACGSTHWMELWTLWRPDYWLAGFVKAFTAAASVPTAIALIFLIPRALSIPSLEQIRKARDATINLVIRTVQAQERRVGIITPSSGIISAAQNTCKALCVA